MDHVRNRRWQPRVRGPLAVLVALALAPAASSVPAASPTGPAARARTSTAAPGNPLETNHAYRLAAQPVDAHLPGPRVSRSRGGDVPVRVSSAKGTRIWTASALSDHGMPLAATRAYRRAADQLARTDPACRIPWTLLAAVGRAESDHGRYGGARLGEDGVSRPRILGVALDGTGPVAVVRDSDDGRLDGDRVWDRAVGPMQFIPATWAFAARDGDGDGMTSPHDLDDAAAAAAAYLCSGAGDLRDPVAQAEAVHRYNQDDYYVSLVLAFEVGYRTGVFVIPDPPPTEAQRAGTRRHLREARRARALVQQQRRRGASSARVRGTEAGPGERTERAGPAPAPRPTRTPPSPSGTPTGTGTVEQDAPAAAPTPSPSPHERTGRMTVCDGGLCLGGALLDLGAASVLDRTATGDFDLDGLVETNGGEVEGLLGLEQVTVVVVETDGRLAVLAINGTALSP